MNKFHDFFIMTELSRLPSVQFARPSTGRQHGHDVGKRRQQQTCSKQLQRSLHGLASHSKDEFQYSCSVSRILVLVLLLRRKCGHLVSCFFYLPNSNRQCAPLHIFSFILSYAPYTDYPNIMAGPILKALAVATELCSLSVASHDKAKQAFWGCVT